MHTSPQALLEANIDRLVESVLRIAATAGAVHAAEPAPEARSDAMANQALEQLRGHAAQALRGLATFHSHSAADYRSAGPESGTHCESDNHLDVRR